MKLILKAMVAILNLIYVFFKLLPVQNKVTFISRQSNDKTEDILMLGDELRKQDTSIDVVFLCKKLEGNLLQKVSYGFHIFKQMYHIATSKVVVLDSYCVCASVLKQRKSLTIIQMWHALGSLKKFGFSIVGEGEGRNSNVADALAMHKNYDYILTSGKACLSNFAEAFGYAAQLDKMKVMSLPRVDKLTDSDLKQNSIDRIYARYPDFKEKQLIVYAPTFRKGRDISKEIDELAKEFDKDKYVFVLKKHPHMDVGCKEAFVEQEFTTLEMLFVADYVVCDYSAVIYEAAILRKPLFFYTFDYESYGVDRDFYIDYNGEMPGFISGNPKEVADAIIDNNYNLEHVADFAHRYVENQEDCTKALGNFVLSCM